MENLKKNTIWNIIGTTINAMVSLLLMIAVTRINGINEAGIFTFSFSFATLLNIVGVYAGRIFQVTDNSKKTNKDYFINRIITCVIMILSCIAYNCIKRYNIEKSLVMLSLTFLKMLEAFSDVLYGYLQKDDKLYIVGESLTLKGIVGTIAFVLIDLITKNYIVSIIIYSLVFLIFVIFYDLKYAKIKEVVTEKYSYKNVKKIFIEGLPTFLASFLTMYLINSSKYAIDGVLSDDMQAVFGIIIMPATIMILITQFIIHPFLNMVNNYIINKDYKNIVNITLKLSMFIVACGVAVILICHFLGIYIIGWIYGLDLLSYRWMLDVILAGAVFYALTSIITTILIAMRHTVIQVVIYGVMSLFTFIASRILVNVAGMWGATANYFITMLFGFIMFVIVYAVVLKKEKSKNKVKKLKV